MFGALWLTVIVISGIMFIIKNNKEDARSKNNAINNNQKYYLDWEGRNRRIDNDHRVVQYVTNPVTRDKIDLDVDSNIILRNYSQEEREQNKKEELRWKEEGVKNKENAIRDGSYYYYVKEKKIDLEVLSSLPPWINDVERERRTTTWSYIYRRVSDDLLVETVYIDRNTGSILIGSKQFHYGIPICVDAKFGFRLYEFDYRRRDNCEVIKMHDKYNRFLCKYHARDNKYNMTEEELLNYAIKIDAIFFKEEQNK